MCCGSPGPALVPAVFAVPARGARVAALTHSSAANKYHRAQVEKGGGPNRDQDASAVPPSEAQQCHFSPAVKKECQVR